ncbi:MAG TPA: protein kinase [Candidatus Binatia bacterium]|nr:protein kinase [Candidatus Binatia bacterium]
METHISTDGPHPASLTYGAAGLPAGRRVGPYLIDRVLGQGGMGVVYRAWDSELERAVALKAIPADLAAIPERAALLTVEARVLAALNHPHIETIHGLIQAEGGTRYLVLEYLEGELLSARLAREPLSLAEALEVGRAVAAALEAAHSGGIIHRDLKPSNVMLTRTGPKVLDFGLAKRFGTARGRDPASTWTGGMAGAGTPGYSSPEQSLGEPQDRRTDLFSLGCLLYECMAGRRAFRGSSAASARRAVLTTEPEWERLPRATPDAVRSLVRRCLAKNPEERLEDAAEARRIFEREMAHLASGRYSRQSRDSGPGRASLPSPLTSFVGRARELREGMALLDRSRLLTLTGPGGCGKTRLSIALAERAESTPRDGICFVDLAPLSDPARMPQAVLTAARVREDPDRPGAELLAEAWRDQEVLLVLDNCEHVIAAAAAFTSALLALAPRVRVLATSREPFQIPGEQIYPVPSLGGDAARLFADRAAAVRPSFALTAKNRAAVEEICEALDGMPLALELAAARAHVLSLAQIKASLQDRFRFLTGTSRAAGRHRTLRSAIDWSFDLLAPEERRFFAALSVFAGGFSLDAAEALDPAAGGGPGRLDGSSAPAGPATLDLLGRLVDKSLVSPPASDEASAPARAPRFRLLETLRSYAADRLAESGEEAAVRDRHLRHFLGAAERACPDLTGPAQAACLDRLEADHENFLAALSWCERRAEPGACGLRLAASLWRFWLARGHFSLGRAVLRTALARGNAEDSTARAEVLMGVGALAFHQNDWDAAAAAYEEARASMERLGVETGVGQALVGLGNVAMGRGAYSVADATYRGALPRFERAGNERGKALVASNRGRVAELRGDLATARALHEEGIAGFERVGDAASLAVRLSSLAELCLKLGDVPACRARLAECLAVVLSLDERRAGCYALERTALLAQSTGDPSAALRWCGAADALRLRIASPPTPAEAKGIEAVVTGARRSLGGAAEPVWAEGRALSFEEAIAGAIRWLGA